MDVEMPPVDVDVVLPVHDEERTLERSVRRLHAHLAGWPSWRITIVDNASTDDTWAVAQRLAAQLPDVAALRLERQGRGLALRTAWMRSHAAVVVYMDIDLSTGLEALAPIVVPLLAGHSDVAIGSRLAPGAAVVRSAKRDLISRGYNLLLRIVFGVRFRDAQCGFKAVRADVAAAVLPHVDDDGWFFDTELLLLAERNGLRIHEVPVNWVDDPDSRVRIVQTAVHDLRGIGRMGIRLARGRGRIGGVPDRRLTAVGPAAMMAACTTTGTWSRSASRAS